MGRRPRPYLKSGWFVTSVGGQQHRKLCRESDGHEEAKRILDDLIANPSSEAPFRKWSAPAKSQTRLHQTWYNMLRRDYEYPTPVCDEWQTFENFEKWSLANGYTDNLTIDRKDNSLGYCPENCRWVTTKEQMNNKTSNVLLTIFGETKNITQWGEDPRCIPPAKVFYDRVYGMRQFRRSRRRVWTLEEALTTPKLKQGRQPGL